MPDPDDGRYSPEVVKNYYSLRSGKKSRKLRKDAKITDPSLEYKASSNREIEPITQSCDQTSTVISSGTEVTDDPTYSSGLQNHSNPVSLAELCRQAVNNMEKLVSKNAEIPTIVNNPETKKSSATPLKILKDITPPSLVESCLRVINSVKRINTPEISQKNVTCEPNGNSHTAFSNSPVIVDNFDEEMGCYIAEKVTLLKDSHKEPSLNSLINQDLLQRPSMSHTFDLLREIDSPQNHCDAIDIMPSCSNDPMLGHISPYSGIGDYSPDDGDCDYQPNEFSRDSSTESDVDNVTEGTRKRAKRGKPNKECWISEANKNKRMKGETYAGRRKTEEGKVVFDIPRRERSLKPRCCHTENSKYFQCHKVTEGSRRSNFNEYWKLSWEAKRVWIKKTVQCQSVARRKCNTVNARRDNTYKYTLNTPEGQFTVCKQMYLHTFDIGEWTIHHWSRNVAHQVHTKNRNSAVKEKEEEGRKYVRDFLNMLAKLESHYCRKSSTKLYLERCWTTKQSLYREYLNFLTAKGKGDCKVSNYIFWDEFDAMNLSLFSPKKDECDVCCSRRVGNLNEEDYDLHILRKNKAREEKSKDKSISDPSVKVFTFDLQAVLLSPALNASALYYKTKLKVNKTEGEKLKCQAYLIPCRCYMTADYPSHEASTFIYRN